MAADLSREKQVVKEILDRMRREYDPDFKDITAAPEGRMVSERPLALVTMERKNNGGWLVEGRDGHLSSEYDRHTRPSITAAFTNTADLLRALADLLEQDDKKREDRANG